MPPLLFTPEEVARFLRIGRCRVYNLLRQGDLASVKVGSSRRVSARALSEYVTQLELGEPA
jgi:excisionase family DNA binding protein